jgi:hypothetical protein
MTATATPEHRAAPRGSDSRLGARPVALRDRGSLDEKLGERRRVLRGRDTLGLDAVAVVPNLRQRNGNRHRCGPRLARIQ